MKFKPRRISLSSSPFYASLGVIMSLGVFMAIFWAFNEYEAYTDSIENIRQSYRTRYRTRVKEELGKVIDFVAYKRSQVELDIESEIRDRVQSAYSIASHMYSQHKDEMHHEELRELVVEVLRPIRWNNGRGYYFAGRVEEATIDLYADDPYFEGKKTLAYVSGQVNDKLSDIIEIIRDKGAGIYRYNWAKPEFVGRGYIMKKEAAESVVMAIRNILGGKVHVSDRIMSRLLDKFHVNPDSSYAPTEEALTDRELEVYRLIGAGLSTREIAARMNLGVKTIGTYRDRIKQKLLIKSAAELTRKAVLWTEKDNFGAPVSLPIEK